MNMNVKSDIEELLEEIQDWMLDNDYECGPHGSIIYDKIEGLRNRMIRDRRAKISDNPCSEIELHERLTE